MIIQGKILSIFILLAISLPDLKAQQPMSSEDSIALVKLRNMPDIEVGKGVSFMPKDSLFRLNMRFRMQNTASVMKDEDGQFFNEFSVKRLRLRFEGFAFSPKLNYVIQLGFSGYDNEGLSGTANLVRDAVIYYVPDNRWSFGFGQAKIPANRARVNSSSALQFADRSITNSTFNLDRDFGFFGTYNTHLFSSFDAVIKTSITSGEGRNFKSSPNLGFAYTGRLELFPLGRFKKLGDIIEGDYEREESPRLMLAAAYSMNHKAIRDRGQRGTLLQNGLTRDIQSLFFDLVFKYNGFAFYTDYMKRMVKEPVVFEDVPFFFNQYIYVGQGLNLQSSYIFRNNWEIAVRWSFTEPTEMIKSMNGFNRETQYTIGLTKYLIGHALKVQLDHSLDQKETSEGSFQYGWMTRFQVELGI